MRTAIPGRPTRCSLFSLSPRIQAPNQPPIGYGHQKSILIVDCISARVGARAGMPLLVTATNRRADHELVWIQLLP
jgi:hypothetical protein